MGKVSQLHSNTNYFNSHPLATFMEKLHGAVWAPSSLTPWQVRRRSVFARRGGTDSVAELAWGSPGLGQGGFFCIEIRFH